MNREIVGYVGVIDGKPVFELSGDDHGDLHSFDVFKTKADALKRWAWARRVRVVFEGEPFYQSPSRGKL